MSTSGSSELFPAKCGVFSTGLETLKNFHCFLKVQRTAIPGNPFELCALKKSVANQVVLVLARENICV